jgi:ketosteroid isomerase-like protein
VTDREPDAGALGVLAELEAANAALYAAVETGDFDAMSALWVDGEAAASAVCVHPGWPAVLGRGPILRSWALIMANTSYIQFFLTEVECSVIDDVGVVSCQENILTGLDTAADDGPSTLTGGRVVATNVFRRGPRGWQAWMHHASPVLARDDVDDAAEDARAEPHDDDPAGES